MRREDVRKVEDVDRDLVYAVGIGPVIDISMVRLTGHPFLWLYISPAIGHVQGTAHKRQSDSYFYLRVALPPASVVLGC